MAEFLVSGKVTLDSGPAAAGAKQVTTEIERMSRSGIAGFEAAQQKVIGLTKEVGNLRNQLLATNDPAAQAKLNAALGQTMTQLRAAKTEFRGMSLESAETNQKVSMLAASLGVNLPMGLERLIGRLPGVQSALGMAFNASIVLAVGAAIASLFPKIAGWIDALRGVVDVDQKLLDKEYELDRLLSRRGKPENLAAMTTELTHVAGRIDEIKQKLVAIEGAPFSGQRLKFGLAAATDLGVTMDRVKALREELGPLKTRFDELKFAIPTEQQKEYNKALDDVKKKESELALAKTQGIDRTRAESMVALAALQKELEGQGLLGTAYGNRLVQLQQGINAAKEHAAIQQLGRQQNDLLAASELKRAEISATAEGRIQLGLAEELRKISELETFREISHRDAEARRVAATKLATAQILAAHDQELRKLGELGAAADHAYVGLADTARRSEQEAALATAQGVAKQRQARRGLFDFSSDLNAEYLQIEFQRSDKILEIDRQLQEAKKTLQSKEFQSLEEQIAAEQALTQKAADAKFAINQTAGAKMAEAQYQALEKVSQQVETFIDRVFLQAKSISDVFHQFLMQMLGSLVKWISREIAVALRGMKQMGTQSSGGGILSSSLGGLFGGGGSAFVGGGGGGGETSAALASVASGFTPGWGGGLEAGAITPLGGGIPNAAGGASSGLLGNLAFGGGGDPMMLAAMAGIAMKGGGVALLSNAYGSGSVGKGILGGLLVLPSVLGAAIGALIGWLGKGKAKRKAANLEDQFHIAADALVDEFKQRKADYDTIVASLQTLEAQAIKDEGQYGGAGRNAIAHIQQMADQRLATLKDIQTIRDANATILAGMSLPEFSIGGGVPAFAGMTGGILALLHPGEFVMRKSAVDSLGGDFLAALNRAPRFDSGGPVGAGLKPARAQVVNVGPINVYPAPGMSEQALANLVVKKVKTAMLDGAL